MKENKKNIIFCLSYLSVPWTLQIIEDRGYDNCIIITNIEPIKLFISDLYSDKQIYLLPGIDRVFCNKHPYKIIKNYFIISKYKKRIKKEFFRLENSNVYFFFTCFGIFESWIIKRLSKRNKTFYKPDMKLGGFQKVGIINNVFPLLEYSLLYGVFFQPLKRAKKIYNGVSDKFLKVINVRDLIIPDNIDIVNKKIKNHFKLDHAKILFLGESIKVQYGFINKSEYIKKTDKLLDYLKNKFGEQSIVIKTHPRFTKKYGKENNFKEIPYYLPGNLIINNFDIVIGYDSSLLYEFANNKKIVYSTLDYYNSNFDKDAFKEYLNKNLNENSTIKYIKNELEIETTETR